MVARRLGAVPLILDWQLHEPGWLTADRLADMPDTVVFHARKKMLDNLIAGRFQLLGAFAAHVVAKGWQVIGVPYKAATQDIALSNPRHLHVFMDDRPVYARNAVHIVPSYLHGFWFADELGSRNNSLMRMETFDPALIDQAKASVYFAQLYSKFVDKNRTKFEQEPRGSVPLHGESLAFFAQDFQTPKHHQHFLTVLQMIEATIAAKGARRLYIKPHPNQGFDEHEALAAYHRPELGVEISHASIHDLLAASDCALTLTSAVGFEAFLHKTPVILGSQTDFWHNAVTLTNTISMPQALNRAMSRDWPFEKFLYWYLKTRCFEDHANALPGVLAKLHRKGFAFADPGAGFF
jgi:Capsule polysaccharide biosynthesis protein